MVVAVLSDMDDNSSSSMTSTLSVEYPGLEISGSCAWIDSELSGMTSTELGLARLSKIFTKILVIYF